MTTTSYAFDNLALEKEIRNEKETLAEDEKEIAITQPTSRNNSDRQTNNHSGICENRPQDCKDSDNFGSNSKRKSPPDKSEELGVINDSKTSWFRRDWIVCNRIGLVVGLLAALFYSGNSFFLKLLSERTDPFQGVTMAMPVLIFASSLAIIGKRPPRPKGIRQYLWLLCGGLSVATYMTSLILSLLRMHVADTVTISYTSLVLVGVTSWIILGEPLRLAHFIFSAIAFIGVVFIARPSYLFRVDGVSLYEGKQLALGICLALLAAVGIALVMTVFRKLMLLGVFKFIIVLSGGICTIVINGTICTTMGNWAESTAYDWLLAMGAGCCYFAAHSCITIALNLEKPTLVTVMTCFEIVFSFLWQFLFLGLLPPWTSYVGATLIASAALGMTLYKVNVEPQTTVDDANSVDVQTADHENKC